MLGRLILGIVKGLIVGGLLGFGLAKLGLAAPGAVIAYLAAALAGVLIGLVAGKPIWAKDAKIEAGMKAFVGALLGVGLMFVARRWLTMPVPVPLGELGGANLSLGEASGTAGTFGGLAITSLAAIAALLGGFYEADNDPSDEATPGAKPAAKAAAGGNNKRIASSAAADDLDEDLEAEAEKKRAKR
ncbi:hypothetical protein SOCEGT47_077110 [Sorangium cellulosum]|uniref:Uncharacterized protein n=1 Tax=Sorangium cellulosum TaxID=56 RepID=A0A4V0NER9_SORCE|nr:hypothetical protein [Sorangium cellulosum]AUX27132.1 hypothetical protein SOCEGT47_077110 [Sorangium cellulosum]